MPHQVSSGVRIRDTVACLHFDLAINYLRKTGMDSHIVVNVALVYLQLGRLCAIDSLI